MSEHFFAFLRGEEEVVPVDTPAFGSAFFTVGPDEMQMDFRMTVNQIQGMTEAHIHVGPRGVDGPVIAFLFGPADPGIDVVQQEFTGTLTREDLTGPLAGQPLSALISEMRDGNTYVNVHTEQYPAGEIRGQIIEM